MTEHPGEQFPPDVDPDVEPGYDPDTEEPSAPDYDVEPGPADHTFSTEEYPSWGTPPAAAGEESGAAEQSAPEVDGWGEAEPVVTAEDSGWGEGEPVVVAEAGVAEESGWGEAEPVVAVEESGWGAGEPVVAEAGVDEGEGSHPLVEETMARLGELRERPVSEHGAVYADLHERLQTVLVEADADERG